MLRKEQSGAGGHGSRRWSSKKTMKKTSFKFSEMNDHYSASLSHSQGGEMILFHRTRFKVVSWLVDRVPRKMEILIKLWMTWLTFSFQTWLMHLGINPWGDLFQDDILLPCVGKKLITGGFASFNWKIISLYPGLNGWFKRDQARGECESWYEARHLGLRYRTSRKCKMASLFGFGDGIYMQWKVYTIRRHFPSWKRILVKMRNS